MLFWSGDAAIQNAAPGPFVCEDIMNRIHAALVVLMLIATPALPVAAAGPLDGIYSVSDQGPKSVDQYYVVLIQKGDSVVLINLRPDTAFWTYGIGTLIDKVVKVDLIDILSGQYGTISLTVGTDGFSANGTINNQQHALMRIPAILTAQSGRS